MASKYHSTRETTNFARLSRVVVDACCDLLRSLLQSQLPHPGLSAILQSQKVHLCKNLEHRQQLILYPPLSSAGVFLGTLEELDFTLLYKLVRNIQGINIPPHQKGWGEIPDDADRSLSANIDRLRVQRNEAVGHLPTASLSDADLNDRWDVIRQSVLEIEKDSLTGDTYVTAVDDLLTVSMDPVQEKLFVKELEEQHQADLGVRAIVQEVKARQETMATDFTTRQEAMATDIHTIKDDVAAVKDTLNATAANRRHTKEFHPDLVPMIEKTKNRIKKEKEKKTFYVTKACRDAHKKLQKNRVVVIKGNTGDGKTATAIQLLHWLSEEQQGRNPLQLHEIKILDRLVQSSQLITFIDDIFGEKDVGKKDVQEWNKRISDVETLFVDEQTQANFLLITIRNEVFNALEESSLGTVFTKDNIIDLSCDTYNIEEEKRELLELYKPKNNTFSWTEEEKENILTCAPNIGFPQCCQLFCNSEELQKERDRFFEKPFEFLKNAMSKLRECSAILFLFLNKGMIKEKDLDPNSEKVNKDLLEEAFNIKLIKGENKSNTLTDKAKVVLVKEDLDRLLGFLVVKEKDWSGDDVYRFDHDSIYVAVALLYGGKTPIGYMQNCPRKSLSYITTSKTSTDMIVISSYHYTHMCERLLREFESEENSYGTNIGSLDVWTDPDFLNMFVSVLNDRKYDKCVVLNKACSYGAKECALYLLSEGVKPDKYTPWWSLIAGVQCGGEGDVDVLKKVVIYLNDEMKISVLNKACKSGLEECALYLLSEGVKPDKDTPLCMGKGGCVNLLKTIVNDLNNEMKLAVLNKACKSGSEECALYLLSEGVKPDRDTPWWPLIAGHWYGGKGDVGVLRKVVIYLNDEMKLAVLNKACASGSEECALYLLSEGVKPDKDTPLCMGKGGCVNLLKTIVNDLNNEMKLAVLNKACESGSEECALYLLSEGVKPDRDTPLWPLIAGHWYGGKGDVGVLRKVVIYLNDEMKLSVLNNACESGSEECALYLLSEGVKPDKDTPLCMGKGGCVNLLKTIVNNLNDEMKLAVLNKACDSGSVECALYLLSEGVKPDNDTPLCVGRGGCVNVLKTIVNDLNDEMKLAVLNKACESGSEECALYLLSEGVKPDKDTPWWSLITGGRYRYHSKGDVDVLRKVVKYVNDEMKVDVLNRACWWGAEEYAFYLLSEGVKPDANTSWWSLITRGEDGKGDVDVLRKVDIYMNDEMKLAVLNKACDSGSVECALYLLSEGVKPDNDTPLCVGRGGCVNVLKTIVNDLNDEMKLAVLNKACESGSEECALYLLSEGVKPDKDTPWWSLITGGRYRYHSKGDVDVLRKVVKYVNDEMKVDVLNRACWWGAEEYAFYLLSEGVKPDANTSWWSWITRGEDGKGDVDVLRKVDIYMNDEMKLAVLNKACESGSEECALYLLSEGVKPDKDTPLWSLITGGEDGYEEDVDVLRKVVTYLNDEMKLAVLNKACLCGAEEYAFYLLSEGVKPDADTSWWSLITRGEYGKGDVDVLRKVDIYMTDEIKLTVLNEACDSGSEECVLYLLSEVGKPDKDTYYGTCN